MMIFNIEFIIIRHKILEDRFVVDLANSFKNEFFINYQVVLIVII